MQTWSYEFIFAYVYVVCACGYVCMICMQYMYTFIFIWVHVLFCIHKCFCECVCICLCVYSCTCRLKIPTLNIFLSYPLSLNFSYKPSHLIWSSQIGYVSAQWALWSICLLVLSTWVTDVLHDMHHHACAWLFRRMQRIWTQSHHVWAKSSLPMTSSPRLPSFAWCRSWSTSCIVQQV